MEKRNEANDARPESGRGYSRREFLKLTGIAGAAVGTGAGLGGLLAACGGTSTTTTGATTATTAASTTSASQAATTTSVSAAVEQGRELKLGFVSPLTGNLATFGTADQYCMAGGRRWSRTVGSVATGRTIRSPSSSRTASPTPTAPVRSRATSSTMTRSM